jgi:hypothetical protein
MMHKKKSFFRLPSICPKQYDYFYHSERLPLLIDQKTARPFVGAEFRRRIHTT